MAAQILPRRRLLPRPEAAAYCGVSLPTFDDLLRRGLVPKPLRWPGVEKMLFDERQLNEAIDALTEPAAPAETKGEWAMS